MSQHLESLKVGDEILCEGPVGMLKYLGFGLFEKKKEKLSIKKRVGLIAAGSGVTPMLSIAQASCLANDGVKIQFLYCNKTEGDIMCR